MDRRKSALGGRFDATGICEPVLAHSGWPSGGAEIRRLRRGGCSVLVQDFGSVDSGGARRPLTGHRRRLFQ